MVTQYSSGSAGSGRSRMSVPAAEADQHVDPHGAGSPRASRPSAGSRTRSSSSGMDASSWSAASSAVRGLAEEHRAVDLEVVVVRAVQRVEVHRAGARAGTSRRRRWRRCCRRRRAGSRRTARRGARACAAGGRRPAPGRAAGRRPGGRLLGRRRHLHQVDVQVQEPGMPVRRRGRARAPGPPSPRGVRAPCGGLAGAQVPQLPRGEVHQRVGVEGGDVEVVGGQCVDGAHGVGVGRVPHRAVLGGGRACG